MLPKSNAWKGTGLELAGTTLRLSMGMTMAGNMKLAAQQNVNMHNAGLRMSTAISALEATRLKICLMVAFVPARYFFQSWRRRFRRCDKPLCSNRFRAAAGNMEARRSGGQDAFAAQLLTKVLADRVCGNTS